ncbi:MAG: hypothetical protein II776_01895, partial [Clostridia bacterium]|nr:hypothetical protein [Clostridia bacterium]
PLVTDRSYYERVPISRGPKNTFEDGDDVIIVLPERDTLPWITTAPPSTTSRIYTVPVITDNPPAPTDPKPTDPQTTGPQTDEPQTGEPAPSSGGGETPAPSSVPEQSGAADAAGNN